MGVVVPTADCIYEDATGTSYGEGERGVIQIPRNNRLLPLITDNCSRKLQ